MLNKLYDIMKPKNLYIYLMTGIFAVLVISGIFFLYNYRTTGNSVRVDSSEPIKLRFDLLSSENTNLCAGPSFIFSMSDDERLQGSCCSPMDFHRYKEQVEGLKKYSYITKIPSDPYDISVSLAKELLDYQKNIQLTPEQQSIYDEAMKMSEEGGPCCCKCWRWYAFEGLAKYLITEYSFNAEQIAEVWDLLDGCGGEGHIEGMHI